MKTFTRWMPWSIVVAFVAWPCAPTAALVVVPQQANLHLTPPDATIPWDNVGNNGIYLGNGWVLTAHHLHATQVTFSVGAFTAQPGSTVRLRNSDNTYADLEMFALTEAPNLSAIRIATATPGVGSEVTFIGDGKTVDSEKYWNVTSNSSPPPNYIWTPVSSSDDYNRSGYSSLQELKVWGTNLVEDDQGFEDFFPDEPDADHTLVVEDPDTQSITVSFFTAFDKNGVTNGSATAHEAQAQGGDSGSGAFVKEGDDWVLAGLTFAVAGFENQPDPTSNAVFGNLTLAADLAVYREQILSIMGIPEPSSFWLVGGVGMLFCAARCGLRQR